MSTVDEPSESETKVKRDLIKELSETKTDQIAKIVELLKAIGKQILADSVETSKSNIRRLFKTGNVLERGFTLDSRDALVYRDLSYTFESMMFAYFHPGTAAETKAKLGNALRLSQFSLLFHRDASKFPVEYKELLKHRQPLPSSADALRARGIENTDQLYEKGIGEYHAVMASIRVPEIKGSEFTEASIFYATQIASCVPLPFAYIDDWDVPSFSYLLSGGNTFSRACVIMAVFLQYHLIDAITGEPLKYRKMRLGLAAEDLVHSLLPRALDPLRNIDVTMYFVLLASLNPVELSRMLLFTGKSGALSAASAARHCKK